MDTSGIEPDPSRKPPTKVLSERDNQLHHVPLNVEGSERKGGKQTIRPTIPFPVFRRDPEWDQRGMSQARYHVFQVSTWPC